MIKKYGKCLDKKSYNKRQIATRSLQNISLTSETPNYILFVTFWSSLSFTLTPVSVRILQCIILCRIHGWGHRVTSGFAWISKGPRKVFGVSSGHWSIQNSVTKRGKRTTRTAFESGQNAGIGVFKNRSIWKDINNNVSLTVINLKIFLLFLIFLITLQINLCVSFSNIFLLKKSL